MSTLRQRTVILPKGTQIVNDNTEIWKATGLTTVPWMVHSPAPGSEYRSIPQRPCSWLLGYNKWGDPQQLASPSADRLYYCQLPGLSYRAPSMIDRTLNTMSLWNKRRKISIFREYLCIIFPFINLECEISDLAFLWALEVWSIKPFLVKSALILPSQGGMPLPWHKSVFHAICLSPLMENQFICHTSHLT